MHVYIAYNQLLVKDIKIILQLLICYNMLFLYLYKAVSPLIFVL